MGPRRGEKGGWYLGFFGGSIWMNWAVLATFVEGLWRPGLGALALAVVNVALIVYLAPWKHPNVRYWKLFLPLASLQIVMASLMLGLLQPHDPSSRFVLYQLSVLSLGLLLVSGRRRWDDATPRPKPVGSAVDGLE